MAPPPAADLFAPLSAGATARRRPAITVAGGTIDRAAFAALVDAVRFPSSGPLVVTGDDVVGTLSAVFAGARSGRPVVVRGEQPAPPPFARTAPSVPPAGLLTVLTSGSSGRPRGVVRTAASWASSFEPFTRLTALTADDTILLTGPLHATLHLFAAVHALWLGAQLTDDQGQATATHAVPAVLDELLTGPPPPRLRTAVVAGAPLPVRVEQRAASLGLRLVEYYGAAELSFVAARVAPDPLAPFDGVELRLRDGELWARSPYLALGTLVPSADGSTFVPLPTSDGYATVGDRAELTEGRLVIRGRGESAVITGGSTVVVEDVEAVLAALPGVNAVAVVGVPHPRLGQVLTAVVELAPTAALPAVRRAARSVLTGPSLPRRWHVVGTLPRLPGGKIARAAAAALVADVGAHGKRDNDFDGSPLPVAAPQAAR